MKKELGGERIRLGHWLGTVLHFLQWLDTAWVTGRTMIHNKTCVTYPKVLFLNKLRIKQRDNPVSPGKQPLNWTQLGTE